MQLMPLFWRGYRHLFFDPLLPGLLHSMHFLVLLEHGAGDFFFSVSLIGATHLVMQASVLIDRQALLEVRNRFLGLACV